MCHILYLPEGVGSDDLTLGIIEKHLMLAAEVNDEGHGMAVMLPDGRMAIGRSMSAPALIGTFIAMRRSYPDGPAVFHSRLATTGVVSEDECHPLMTPDKQTAVFLNGTLDVHLAEGQTDTRAFAETWLAGPPALDLDVPAQRECVEELARRTNAKLVIMTQSASAAEQVYIINRSQWITTTYGALASNADHLGKGEGWDEAMIDGDLYRWRIVQPGQCAGCHLRGCERGCAPRPFDPPAFRNETRRRREVKRPCP